MTELEQRLLNAFEALSNQYETEQQRQARRISSLSQQVLRLAQQQTVLIDRYNQVVELLAEELR